MIDEPLIDPTEELVYCVLSGIIERDERASALAVGDWAIGALRPRSVIDLGCNNGLYLLPFSLNGSIVFGVDAIPTPPGGRYCPPGNYKRHDLRKPFYARVNDAPFDLCLCLETLEHIHIEHHETVVKSCCECAKTVIFSCAVPNQGGQFHHAERTHEEVIALFEGQGWHQDEDLTANLRASLENYGAVSPWLIANTMVFRGSE